jgi:hypothetical protein
MILAFVLVFMMRIKYKGEFQLNIPIYLPDRIDVMNIEINGRAIFSIYFSEK